MSSGQLYNKPVYGYVFPGTTHGCNGRPANINTQHFWIEHSIVPLGGFEGNHIGYGLVQEYYKAAGTGYYTPLVRCVRKFLYFTSECQVCVAREQLSCDTYYTLRLRRA